MHQSVMLSEAVDALNIKSDGIYVDATLGYAGHSEEILKRMKKRGFLFAFDQDGDAILISQQKLSEVADNFQIIRSNFCHLKKSLESYGITKIDGILFDLGVSSPQIDEAERGFSFMKDAPLDMRMDSLSKLRAYDIVNTYSSKELFEIFISFGEEKFSSPIAKKIEVSRMKKPIATTLELVEIIKSAVPKKYWINSHPERRIFQALRIAVNDELGVLDSVLPQAIELLNPGGRICVITFHSLEDRIVKKVFKKYSEVPVILRGLPDIPDEYKPHLKLINKKPITPSNEEVNKNHRSASSKLRIGERI